jgi:transportin-1
LENAAICIGRLGLHLAPEIAPHYNVFINAWVANIKPVEETDEKDSALRGMCHIVATNPGGLSGENVLLSFVELCALYIEPSPELADILGKVLQGFKSLVPNWDDMVMSKLDPVLANSLRQRYYL